MRPPRVPALLPLFLVTACFGDRPRPSPVGPDADLRLVVEVLAPAQNSPAAAGHPVRVQVAARDLDGGRVAGLGFVAYRAQGGVRIDSAVVSIVPAVPAARDTFEFVLPADYPTSAQVDIYGLAFGAGGASRRSEPRSIVTVRTNGAAGAGRSTAASRGGMESARYGG